MNQVAVALWGELGTSQVVEDAGLVSVAIALPLPSSLLLIVGYL